MATVTTAPGLPGSSNPRMHSDPASLSTLPDPRSPDLSPDISRSNSTHHPDLSTEIATLSNKLINAINHQTNLDDTLSATRHELNASQERVRQLEMVVQQHRDLIGSGTLIKRTDVEDKTVKLMANLADEKKQRDVVEKDKRGIEQELESLTTALFEEANEMVAVARKDREAVERRNEQLRAQLNDTELLLVSHQEQLTELKAVMQQMSSEQEDQELNTNTSTTPSTPAMQNHEPMNRIFDALHLSPNLLGSEENLPAPPTSFTHLLHPILRTDLQAYDDFYSLLQTSRKSTPGSRVTSGSFGGLSVAGLGHLASRQQSNFPGHQISNGSSSSLSTHVTQHSSSISPSTPASANSSVSSRDSPLTATPLKETRFYKRALSEDVEPTLRLEAAPGLSWLARRTVINSMCEGSLVVEPIPSVATLYIFSCSLCGENRRGDEYARTHRFRTNENENAQRYPLCPYCLNRMRASCDFLGFLRMVKDGHWRTDGVEAENAAWEESVRLRERMFWARIGGGVLPAFVRTRESPRSSVEEDKLGSESMEIENTSVSQRLENEQSHSRPSVDPFHDNDEKRLSVGRTHISQRNKPLVVDDSWRNSKDATTFEDKMFALSHEEDEAKQPQNNIREAQGPESSTTTVPEARVLNTDLPLILQVDSKQKPPIQIPGAFDF